MLKISAFLEDRPRQKSDSSMLIRPYTHADLSAVAQIFTDAIHGLAVSHYDEAQRAAWAPRPPDLRIWEARLKPIQVLVAQEGAESAGKLLGFIGYENNGHIDLMFTSPTAARRGIASRLLGQVEAALRERHVQELFTEASLLGRPFFEHQGFTVKEEQHIELRGAQFRRFAMVKAMAHSQP